MKTEIVEHGQIIKMVFPEGWVEGPREKNPGIGARSFREVHPEASPKTMLCFFYRGLPISDNGAANFRSVLEKPPHELTADEIKSLKEVLKMKTPIESAQFQIASARTEVLNGKKVLIVEGSYPEAGEQIYEIYIDADGSGEVIQEIYFQAPQADYEQYLPAAQEAIRSIVWR